MSDERDPNEETSEEEETVGSLSPSDELAAALQAATDSVEARQAGGKGARPEPSLDKATIEALSHELQGLNEQHANVLEELEALKDKHLRLQAEFENFRRRGLKERQETLQYGHQNLVKDLLPTVDNLERAIAHAEESEDGDLQSLLQGVDLVLKDFLGVLQRYGVAMIEAEGLPFDPQYHEAMAQAPDATVPPNSIVEVLQRGYQLRDRMLRPARVVVSTTPEGDGGKPPEGDEES